MSAIADGLKVTPEAWEPTGSNNVLRPRYGSIDNIGVKVEKLKIYSESKSKLTGKEEYEEKEIVLFDSDRFSKTPVPVKHLSLQQRRKLTPLIEAFREQKETDETKIINWQAIDNIEKQFCMEAGIFTVEQASHFNDSPNLLGPSGKEIIKKAKKHVEGKLAEKSEQIESLEEVKALRAEVEALKAAAKSAPAEESKSTKSKSTSKKADSTEA